MKHVLINGNVFTDLGGNGVTKVGYNRNLHQALELDERTPNDIGRMLKEFSVVAGMRFAFPDETILLIPGNVPMAVLEHATKYYKDRYGCLLEPITTKMPKRGRLLLNSTQPDSPLWPLTLELNNKNNFYSLLKGIDGLGIRTPKAILYEDPTVGADADTLMSKADQAFPNGWLLKSATGAGGHGIAKGTNTDAVKAVLAELQKKTGANRCFQIAESLPVKTPITGDRKTYYSPCIIAAIHDNGYTIQAVSEQVFSAPGCYGGSYWNKQLQDKFVSTHKDVLDKLLTAIYNIGYRGMFGTDFVLLNDGSYALVCDANARMNGSHVPYMLRNALLPNAQETYFTTKEFTTPMSFTDFDIWYKQHFANKEDVYVMPNYGEHDDGSYCIISADIVKLGGNIEEHVAFLKTI